MKTPIGKLLNKEARCLVCNTPVFISPSNPNSLCRLHIQKLLDDETNEILKESKYTRQVDITWASITDIVTNQNMLEGILNKGYKLHSINNEFMFFERFKK